QTPVNNLSQIDEDTTVSAFPEERLRAPNQLAAARICVRETEEQLPGNGWKRLEKRIGLANSVSGDGCRMIRNHRGGRLNFDSEARFQFLAIEQSAAKQVIKRRSARAMYAPLLFAHRDHSGARNGGGGE